MGNEITREMYMGPAGGAEQHGPHRQQHGQQHGQQQQHEHSEQLGQLGQQQLGQQQQLGEQHQSEQDKRQHPNTMQSVRGDQVRPAAEAARARKERLAREKSGASDRIMSSTVSPSQRTMIAAKGRKLFSDFHIAQAEYAQEWGKSQGEEGVADLFQTEAPRLHRLYEIVRAEAAGVTAVVFRGKSLKTGQIVALKFVRIQVKGISDEARRKDCKEEARLQRLCAHENVVNLLDFEVGQKFAIFVLEYVDRTLLQKIVDSNENELYCERTAAKYIRDIALALQKCHARGVVHMDVKLDNILCTAGNVAKLCDFGVAEQMHHPNAPIHRHVAAPLFAPPEVHTLGLCDTAADMWSLGVVLYILLCGYPPFKETELKKRILHARYVFPERDWTQVSVMARDLVSRLLVLDVAQRFTADQVLAHPWIQALSTMPSRAEQPSTASSTSASHTTSTDGGHFNSTKNSAIDKQNVDDVNDDVNNAANDADDDKEEDADEEEKKQRQIFSSAASAPLGGHGEGQGQGGQVGPFGPNTNVAATAEVRTVPTKLLDELDTTSVPLPVRVTGFLRRMHHFRELEKRGFDSIPGGEMYRNLLDGVDDIATSIVRSCSPSPSSSSQESVSMGIPSSSVSSIASSQLASTSSWLSRRIDSTLFRETSSSSSTPPHPPSSDSTAASDDDVFAGAASTLARPSPESSSNVPASGDLNNNEQDAGDENDEDDEDDGTESSESPLTEKDLLVQAKFKRRESIVSAAEGMSRPRPRRKSSSATKPPKATQAAPPPRSKRLVREKSFDVQPEEVMDWIDDSEAVSCRICDAEFTLFVRKHHCRNCSNLMCDSCSSHRRRLKILEVKEAVRVCKLCAAHLPNHR